MNAARACGAEHGAGRRMVGRVVLVGACALALAGLLARPAEARANVFIGATFSIPLPVYPVYAPPLYYPPPPAYYAPPPPSVYVNYGPRWLYPPHNARWKNFYPRGHGWRGYYR